MPGQLDFDGAIAEDLRQRTEELTLVVEAGRVLGSSLDLATVYESLAGFVSRLMDCDSLFVSWFDPETELITCAFARIDSSVVDAAALPPIPLEPEGKGIQSRAIRSGLPLIVNDFDRLAEESTVHVLVDECGGIHRDVPGDAARTRSGLVVPIVLDGKVRGAVQVLSNRRSAYGEEHLRLLEALVSQLAVASNNALLYQRMNAELAERQRAEEELRRSEERFRWIAKASNDAIWDWDLVTDKVWWSDAFLAQFGLSPEELATGLSWPERVHPDDRQRFLVGLGGAIGGGATSWSEEYRVQCADGHNATVFDRAYILHDAEGRPVRVIGAMMDITGRKRLEEQLLQSQKMEGIGRLAGGVAHDFNNNLSVILGYAEMLLEDLPAGDRNRELVQEMQHAGESAASLTRQLLAFARQQIIEPRPIDLNEVVLSMQKMLHRLIGEDVQVAVRPAPNPCVVVADPGQVEQVLVNLAVNARDAMPAGGRLTIELNHVSVPAGSEGAFGGASAGDYAVLAVADTGSGMDEATRQRVFEPFFTTKDKGKGTGLGLSTVYGIVKQAGGTIVLYSEPGIGTTFKIYLPLEAAPTSRADQGQPAPGAVRGVETVLLVEDEPGVRTLARRALEGEGYAVLEARDGADALQVAAGHPGTIDILVTDVVMPGMDGKELARRLTETRPGTAVLFTSGYSDHAIVQHGVLEEGVEFLQKPFTPRVLAGKVRDVLDRA